MERCQLSLREAPPKSSKWAQVLGELKSPSDLLGKSFSCKWTELLTALYCRLNEMGWADNNGKERGLIQRQLGLGDTREGSAMKQLQASRCPGADPREQNVLARRHHLQVLEASLPHHELRSGVMHGKGQEAGPSAAQRARWACLNAGRGP